MVDFSKPYMPNALSNMQALTLGGNYFRAQQLDEDKRAAGQIAASGDLAGAQNALMAQGHIDEAEKLRGIANSIEDRKLALVKDAYSKMGNLARLATTPEQWAQAIQAAKSHGLDTAGYEDFNAGRQMALAQSNKVSEVIDEELKRRELSIRQQALAHTQAKARTYYEAGQGEQEGRIGFDPATGSWSGFVPNPEGVRIGEAIGATPGSGRAAAVLAGPEKIRADYKTRFGKELDWTTARRAWKEGLDVQQDASGNPTTVAGTHSEQSVREQRLDLGGRRLEQNEKKFDPELQRELSEYKQIGKEDGQLAQRKSIAGGALNHLETVAQISDADLENAIGVIQGNGGYQMFMDAVNSGRVNDAVAYRNARQTLSVLIREIENSYHIAGTGADTDARMKEVKENFSPESMLASPNIQVFRQRLNNMRAILQGVINAPRPSAFGSRSPATAGSAAAEKEVRRVSGAPEAGGQVQRQPHEMTDEEIRRALGL